MHQAMVADSAKCADMARLMRPLYGMALPLDAKHGSNRVTRRLLRCPLRLDTHRHGARL